MMCQAVLPTRLPGCCAHDHRVHQTGRAACRGPAFHCQHNCQLSHASCHMPAVTWYSTSEQSGDACEASEEDGASVYGYTGTTRADSQGMSGQAREENASSVHGTSTPVHYEQTVREESWAGPV